MLETFNEQFSGFLRILMPSDVIDLIIVAYIMYKGLNLVRETRAGQLVKGILIVLAVLQISYWLQLNTINFILRNTMQVGVIAIIVVFQPELRRALEQVGRSSISTFSSNEKVKMEPSITSICEAVSQMSLTRTGALIVFERDTKIADIIRTGTQIEANITAELVMNIFVENTPLHDGALVIRDGKIAAAACLLPLTSNENINRELGTRHRAALGLSETSDALVVVVSEETGKVSLAKNGNMLRSLSIEMLKKVLSKEVIGEVNSSFKRFFK